MLRRPSLDYTLFATFARIRAERVNALSSGTKRLILMNATTPPRDPTQVPDGDLNDAIKPGNPTPSDFNDDDDEDLTFEDMEDESDEDDNDD